MIDSLQLAARKTFYLIKNQLGVFKFNLKAKFLALNVAV